MAGLVYVKAAYVKAAYEKVKKGRNHYFKWKRGFLQSIQGLIDPKEIYGQTEKEEQFCNRTRAANA